MTSNAMTDAVRSSRSVAIRWKSHLSNLAATQPPPTPAILRSGHSDERATDTVITGEGAIRPRVYL